MGLVQKTVRSTVALPARGIKKVARVVTTPLRERRERRAR